MGFLRASARRRSALLLVAAAALLATACAGAPEPAGPAAAAGRAPAPVEGDPTAPHPLPERASVEVGVSSKILSYAPVLLAGPLGEFEAENLDVTVTVMPAQEQLLLLSQGELDVAATAVSAGMLNIVADGADIRAVVPDGGRSSEGRSGIWVRKDALGDNGTFEPDDLLNRKIGLLGGREGIIGASLFAELERRGATYGPADLDIEPIGSADAVQALQNGAVAAASANSPFHTLLQDDPCCEFLPGGMPERPLAQYAFGPALLDERPEVGAAFVRALTRTVREHLQGDYIADPRVRDELATAIELAPERLTDFEPSVFDPTMELPTEVLDMAQSYYGRLDGVLRYDEPLGVEDFYDTSFVEAVQEDGA